jgi:ABC-type lipoprotein release transport system permease subunit
MIAGADENEIGWLFVAELGVIGIVRTTVGVVTGWTITHNVSAIVQAHMKNQGIPPVDAFALPTRLVLISMVLA